MSARSEAHVSVLVWSAVSGLVVGLFAGLLLLGVLALGAALAPAGLARLVGRLRGPVLVVCLVIVPALGAVVGYVEGRLKLR